MTYVHDVYVWVYFFWPFHIGHSSQYRIVKFQIYNLDLKFRRDEEYFFQRGRGLRNEKKGSS